MALPVLSAKTARHQDVIELDLPEYQMHPCFNNFHLCYFTYVVMCRHMPVVCNSPLNFPGSSRLLAELHFQLRFLRTIHAMLT